jgi:hypothetical protein
MSLKDRIDVDEYISGGEIVFPQIYTSQEQALISLLHIQSQHGGVPADVDEIASYTTYSEGTIRPRLHELKFTKNSREGW